jgi:hypothetical protein
MPTWADYEVVTAAKLNALLDTSVNYQTPLTGAALAMAASTGNHLVINPAGTLAALTVTLPVAPLDCQIAKITTTQTLTALTLGGSGVPVIGGITAMAAGTTATYRYIAGGLFWLRIDKPS